MEGISEAIYTENAITHKLGIRYTSVYRQLITLYMSILRQDLASRDVLCQIIRKGFDILFGRMVGIDPATFFSRRIVDDSPDFPFWDVIERSDWVTVIFCGKQLTIENSSFKDDILAIYDENKS